MRTALGLEYDGSGFLGWQTQPGAGTVQDALEAALGEIAGTPVATVCAGRTDRGVHATAQVVHFDAPVERPDSAWVKGANTLLPPSVAILWAKRTSSEFHARYSARSRTYRYVLINRPVRPALAARHAGWFHAPLDVAAMRAAALFMVGEHDFSAFRSAACQAKNPLRILHCLSVEQLDGNIVFTLRANAFLHHMVRNIVGALVHVGKGTRAPEWLREVRESRDRSRCAPTFAPQGLYLTGIEYGAEWQLPAASVESHIALLRT